MKLEQQAIAQELQSNGWVPLKGVENVLTRGPILIGLGVTQHDADYYSGKGRTDWETVDCGPCPDCNGTGEHPHLKHITLEWATAHPDEFRRFSVKTFGIDSGNATPGQFAKSGAWKCNATHPARGFCVEGRVLRQHKVQLDQWPVFHATPRGHSFHVERDGRVISAGRIARGFDWRTPQHPGRSDHAAFTKSMRAVTRAIDLALNDRRAHTEEPGNERPANA